MTSATRRSARANPRKPARKKVQPRTASHNDFVVERLRRDPAFAAAYLSDALDDTDEPTVALIALRRIAEACGGISKVAKLAGVQRESLHRALSENGNPRLTTLLAVAKAVGLRFSCERRSA
jgi:probable addiction module antidote protein